MMNSLLRVAQPSAKQIRPGTAQHSTDVENASKTTPGAVNRTKIKKTTIFKKFKGVLYKF